MHTEAKEFIRSVAEAFAPEFPEQAAALDLGGRETNGHARDVFGDKVEWLVVDAVEGPGVDVVADAATYGQDESRAWDLVMCAEVFEHTPRWPEIIHNAHRLLWKGGLFVTTMAGPGREVHGLFHDDPDQPGWYENIEPRWLKLALRAAGFRDWMVQENEASHDVYAWARK